MGHRRAWAAFLLVLGDAVHLQHACTAELRPRPQRPCPQNERNAPIWSKGRAYAQKKLVPTWPQNRPNIFQADCSLHATTHCMQPMLGLWTQSGLCPFFPLISCLTVGLLLHLSEPHLSKWRCSCAQSSKGVAKSIK